MSGWASTTSSPSRVTTTRSTPCVLGCCGPRFRVINWLCRPSSVAIAAPPFLPRILADAHLPLAGRARVLEVLAQRVAAREALGQQDPAQVGVVVEPHAQQAERLALVPVGARPDPCHALRPAVVGGRLVGADAQG